ncbi:MAG: hypothetical protein AAFV53_01830 [Myxococcota bacterium]
MFLLFGLAAWALGDWLTLDGAGGLSWGSRDKPPQHERRSRSDFLPDSGFIGTSASDRPEDLELPAPSGERRFVRYVDGALVDAWLVRDGAIRLVDIEREATPEWAGVILGPAEPGWRAFGFARSWSRNDRTILHWDDRSSDTEIVASRARSTQHYAIQRAAPVDEGLRTSPRKVQIRGDLKSTVSAYAGEISGCLDPAPKPVTVTVSLRYDGAGRPARVKVETDQPSFHITECIAGAISKTRAPGETAGVFTAFRMR